jgi:DNA-binding beta-propeller fold protein YncE
MSHGFRNRFILVIAAIAMCGRSAYAQENAQPNSLPNPYRVVDSWGQLPEGRTWGSVSAISVDKKGNVWVGDRCGKNDCSDSNLDSVLEFDSSGKLLRSFGGGMFAMPHAINFDKAGNFWFADYGNKNGKGTVVVKFTPEGKILMTLGKPGVAGAGPDTFSEPDAVVEGKNGDLFVADGHTLGKGNARIVKFTKDGKFIKEWGEHGSGPGQFEIPHDLAIDSRGRIFVADRGNKRIQIFDQDGKFLEEWKQFGTPSGLFIDRHDVLYVSDSWSQSTDPKSDRYNPGFEHGFHVGSAKDGKVMSFTPVPATAGGQNAPEGITADDAGNIYVADTIVKGVKKYVKQ